MSEVFNRLLYPNPVTEKYLLGEKEFAGCVCESVKTYYHKGMLHTKRGSVLVHFFASELKQGDIITRKRDGAQYKVLGGGKHDGVRGMAPVKRMVQP